MLGRETMHTPNALCESSGELKGLKDVSLPSLPGIGIVRILTTSWKLQQSAFTSTDYAGVK